MATTNPTTMQTNIKQYGDNNNLILNYSLFLGGMNVTQKSLEQYDPLRTGYNRIFFTKMPEFMDKIMPNATKRIRHILEYGFTEINGINGTTLDFEQATGGYAGRQFDVANVAKDDTNEISITTYEFSGSPVREYMDMWITGIADPYTGVGTYHGALDGTNPLKYQQSNHVAEAIYVATDPTGRSDGIEYACLLTNMMPKQVKKDQFNYQSGQHGLVTMETSFTCVKYESPQINTIAAKLMDRFKVMSDYLEFDSGYSASIATSRDRNKLNNWANDTDNQAITATTT